MPFGLRTRVCTVIEDLATISSVGKTTFVILLTSRQVSTPNCIRFGDIGHLMLMPLQSQTTHLNVLQPLLNDSKAWSLTGLLSPAVSYETLQSWRPPVRQR